MAVAINIKKSRSHHFEDLSDAINEQKTSGLIFLKEHFWLLNSNNNIACAKHERSSKQQQQAARIFCSRI